MPGPELQMRRDRDTVAVTAPARSGLLDRLRSDRTWVGSPPATAGAVVLGLAMVIFGHALGPYYQTLIGMGGAYLISAFGYSIALQFAGQFLFCQAAFMAIGGYSLAMLEPHVGAVPAFAIGALISGAIGLVLGAGLLRVSDIYLAIVTLAFGQTVLLVPNVWALTGGEDGISVSLGGGNAYIVTSVAAVIVIILVSRSLRSHSGRDLALTRTNVDVGRACGVSVNRVKIATVGVAGLLGGIGGMCMAGILTYLTPDNFELSLTLLLLAAIVIGNRSVLGTVIGVAIMSVLSDLAPSTGNSGEYISAVVLFLALTLQHNTTSRAVLNRLIGAGRRYVRRSGLDG